MNEKIKLLIVYPEMMIGGSTTSLLGLLNELDEDRYDVDLALYVHSGVLMDYIPNHVKVLNEVCTVKSSEHRLKKLFRLTISGYMFKSILLQKKYGGRASGQVLMDARVRLFSRSIAGKEYDIAIGYLEGWPIKYVVSDKVRAKRKIGWIHLDYQKSPYIPKLDYKAIKALDTVVSVSAECEKNNRVLFDLKDSRYLPNLLSAKFVHDRAAQTDTGDKDFLNWSRIKKTKFITVCRIENVHKGIDRAVLTAKYLRDKGLDFAWYIIGDGNNMWRNQEQIERYGLQDRIKMIGARLNPYPFIKSADLFVLPSRFEGKPMVITETMMLKVPAVVTEYASAGEQIRDGIDGLVVPNRDDALFAPLEKCLMNPEIISGLKAGIPNEIECKADIVLYDELLAQ